MSETVEAKQVNPNPEPGLGEKACRQCFKPIDARAKRCPYCQSFQSKLSVLRHPQTVAMLVGTAFAIVVLIFVFTTMPFDLWARKGEFANDGQGLKVVQSKLTVDDSRWLLLGTLKNETAYDWQGIQFEVVFKNPAGEQIDSALETIHATAPAGQEVEIRLTGRIARPKSDYASHSIRIVTADHKRF